MEVPHGGNVCRGFPISNKLEENFQAESEQKQPYIPGCRSCSNQGTILYSNNIELNFYNVSFNRLIIFTQTCCIILGAFVPVTLQSGPEWTTLTGEVVCLWRNLSQSMRFPTSLSS